MLGQRVPLPVARHCCWPRCRTEACCTGNIHILSPNRTPTAAPTNQHLTTQPNKQPIATTAYIPSGSDESAQIPTAQFTAAPPPETQERPATVLGTGASGCSQLAILRLCASYAIPDAAVLAVHPSKTKKKRTGKPRKGEYPAVFFHGGSLPTVLSHQCIFACGALLQPVTLKIRENMLKTKHGRVATTLPYTLTAARLSTTTALDVKVNNKRSTVHTRT